MFRRACSSILQFSSEGVPTINKYTASSRWQLEVKEPHNQAFSKRKTPSLNPQARNDLVPHPQDRTRDSSPPRLSRISPDSSRLLALGLHLAFRNLSGRLPQSYFHVLEESAVRVGLRCVPSHDSSERRECFGISDHRGKIHSRFVTTSRSSLTRRNTNEDLHIRVGRVLRSPIVPSFEVEVILGCSVWREGLDAAVVVVELDEDLQNTSVSLGRAGKRM